MKTFAPLENTPPTKETISRVQSVNSLTGFAEKVFDVVRKIPKGKTLNYKEVAMRAGRPHASRSVGNILNKNYNPKIPCHRVIRSDGKLGGYNRGVNLKKQILEKERYTQDLKS